MDFRRWISMGFDHGWAGIGWVNREYRQWVNSDDPEREKWEQWEPVAGCRNRTSWRLPCETSPWLDYIL